MNQVLFHIKRNIIEKKKKLISEIEVTKSKNETEYDIEHQNSSDFSLLIFRKEWINIKREDNENIDWSFHRL